MSTTKMEETAFTTKESISKKPNNQEIPKLIVTNEDVDPVPTNLKSSQSQAKDSGLSNWRFWATILVPVLLAPLLAMRDDDEDKKYKCSYVVILMVVSWMLQLLPIGVTSMLPLLLFPVLGVLDAAQVSKNYVKETTVLFVGGLIIALAVEYCNLHRRIALGVMKSVGCSPSRLTLGTMLTTAFLSMWINNTATAGLTIPIVSATVDEIFQAGKVRNRERKRSAFRALSTPDLDNSADEQARRIDFCSKTPSDEMRKRNLKKMLLLSVCLSANIGGTAVITGSASNLIFHQQLKSLDIGQNGKYLDISFATWMLYNIPPVLVNLVVCWFYLVLYFDGVPEWLYSVWSKATAERICQRKEDAERQRQVELLLAEKYKNLGSISFHESAVLSIFLGTILLWFFRDPGFTTGWAPYLPNVKDSTVAILAVFLFFIVPRLPGAGATLLDWKYVQDSLPWGLVILLGGGFSMSDGIVQSGLSNWLGGKLMHLSALPNALLLFVVMLFTLVCTSVTSNAATASTLLALLTPLSKSLSLHPLFLTLPTTVTCSYAFLLPISTPPNALVHQAAGEDLSVGEMVKVMCIPNICCLIILFLFHISYGNLIFHFDDYIYHGNGNITLI